MAVISQGISVRILLLEPPPIFTPLYACMPLDIILLRRVPLAIPKIPMREGQARRKEGARDENGGKRHTRQENLWPPRKEVIIETDAACECR